MPYSTNYTSINATPHKVKFVTNSTCMPLHPTHGKGAQPGVPCPTSFVVDEQGNDVTFALGHTTVQGGGVIYTINAVSRWGEAAYQDRAAVWLVTGKKAWLTAATGSVDAWPVTWMMRLGSL